MPSSVGERIRPLRCAQERKADHASLDVVAVLRPVQEADPIALLGEVGPALGGDFELGFFPTVVEFRGAPERAVGDLVGCRVVLDRHRKRDLEHGTVLPPIHVSSEVNPVEVRVKADILGEEGAREVFGREALLDSRLEKVAGDSKGGADRPLLQNFDVAQAGRVLYAGQAYVPGVPHRWRVLKDVQLVSRAAEDLPFHPFVYNAFQPAGIDVEPDSKQLVLQRRLGSLEAAPCRPCAYGPQLKDAVTNGGDILGD